MRFKYFFRLVEQLSPLLTAKIAFHYISNPRVKKYRSFEKSISNEAEKSVLKFKKFKIAHYKWGKGDKKALLVHGWEGRASNFGAIIPLLVNKGFTVESFDAPGHGNSSKKKASFFDPAELVSLFLKNDVYDLVITHSMGSVMTLLAMSEMNHEGNRLIVCTTPDKFEDYVEQTIAHFGLTAKTKGAFLKLIRKKTGYEPSGLQANLFVQNIQMNKAIFVHDHNDRVIKIENTKNVSSSMTNSKFITLEKSGHFKMLWSDQLLKIVADTVN